MVEFVYLKYCGDCAGRLNKVNDTEYRCETCGKPTFNGPSAACGVLVFRDDTVLLSKRAIEPGKGLYDEPGGFCNWMEHPDDTARREFREETGCELESLRVFKASVVRYTQNQSVAGLIYIGTIPDDAELAPNDDVSELAWVNVKELSSVKFSSDVLPSVIEEAYLDVMSKKV